MGATSGVLFLLDLLSLFPNGFLLCDHGQDLRDRLMCEFNQSITINNIQNSSRPFYVFRIECQKKNFVFNYSIKKL